ncbi:unnamed protein product [Rotaria sordida]|uniref:Uncharacterized protein n=1 Tax=Rotaria sordida TaxID=392033 RepID=A0A815DAS6_9BILA|nr:unnamed protein product [Rotaria sordida]
MTQLGERMKRTEERIQQYKDEDRNDEAKIEEKYLNALKQLKDLSEEISLKSALLLSQNIDKLDLSELENRLTYGLEKYKIKDVTQLTERIKRSKKRIEQYEDEDRTDAAEQEIRYVRDLEQLQRITEEIFYRKSTEPILKNDDALHQKTRAEEIIGNVSDSRTFREEENKRADLKNLLDDLVHMPYCAEKTIMELLADFQQTLLRDCIVNKMPDSVIMKLGKLQDQIQKEELFSEQIKTYLQDLNQAIHNEDCSSIVRILTNLLKKTRPLYLQEIQRLIEKTKKTAELISDKDIILLVGITGSGKSTTIQFLTGAKMKDTLVEIAPGRFLEHITIYGPVRNVGLNSVTSSPLSKSETRYIIPITVKLEDIFGLHETGEIILCDAPGFGDTTGPEVDIANSVGVIEALKNCKSVKILALSSYRSLGDRGQGIQKLAHILINMIRGIEDRLYGILYAFTKYPSTTDIHALLSDIKASKVDTDPLLQSDNVFVTVLTDMIDKTRNGVEKIDPIHGNPKSLIQKLKSLKGIYYPGEVIRFSMSEETQNIILNQVEKYKLSIMCALKHKDIDLIMYCFNNFKFLSDLIKQSFVRDAYEDSIRFISENIQQYCTDVIEKFNRYLVSQDGLKEEDIREYKTAHNYIQQIQNLKEHLGSKLVSSKIFIENILSKLEKRNIELQEQDLYSPSIGIYLDNFRLLQNSFNDLESYYKNICQDFTERFESTLIKSVPELISKNECKQVAERIYIISRCLPILNYHLNGKVEENYHDIIKLMLQHLNSFSEETNSILMKITLNNDDIKILHDYMILLSSAKETSLLQNQIFEYIEIMKIKNNISIETIKDLNKIYDEFIVKIIKYFNDINLRIEELLKNHGPYAFEDIERLVIQMEMIRTLPDVESKTARTFYHSIQNIRGYMQQLQRDAENLLHTLDHQSGVIDFRPLSRLLLRLKKTEWIDRICEGTYNSMIRHIRDELEERANQLESRLMRLDLSLKFPENIRLALEIIEKIESMNILENTIPILKNYRDRINEYFIKIINEVFNHIKKTFNFANKTIDHLKQELIEIEQIKNEYDTLYPARSYLRKFGYSDIDILNQKIENLRVQHDVELKEAEAEKSRMESQLDNFNITIRHYQHLTSSKIGFGIFDRLFNTIGIGVERVDIQPNEYLKQKGYLNIEIFNDTMTKVQKDYDKQLRLIEQRRTEFNNTLTHFESIIKEYDSLLASSNLISSKVIDFLQEKGQYSYELLEKTIQEKKKILTEYEKCKQKYYFTDKLDALVANNALIYISNCEKVGHHHVKKVAADMSDFLRKYIEEYGDFLNKEIIKNFANITNLDESDPNQYSNNLEKCFEELFSLNKYTLVFESLHGVDKIEHWRQQVFNYHRLLDNKMEVYKIDGINKELRSTSIIAQALSCLDRFCRDKEFRALHRQCQFDIAKRSREAYDRAIDYVSKEDYANANFELDDVIEDPPNQKFLTQIKNKLQPSLSKVIKNTKTCAHHLNGKIERVEDNRNEIREINENIEKIRIVLNEHHIMELIDKPTKEVLQNFENEINEILSKAILNAIENIKMFIEANSFLEAEQYMKNLKHAQNGLASYYTSKSVYNKIEELEIKLNCLVSDILQRYDFSDINNYSKNPPKDLITQLKKVISGGYAKYTQVHTSLMEKIQDNFSRAIDKVHQNSLNDRSTKIRSIKYAFHFLPEELKTIFQFQIDELNQSNVDQNRPLEFD